MNNILSLVRENIRALKPYSSARSLQIQGKIFLDANENPGTLFENSQCRLINRYPDPQPPEILESASKIYSIPRESILVGRGADEGIEVLVRTLCEPGQDNVLICPPTYGVYETAAQIQGCGIIPIPLIGAPNFKLDMDRILKALADPKRRIKIVFICSPNNPTGTDFDPEEILHICRAAAGRSLVAVDEAYVEFSGRSSLSARISEHPNLVVLRTLSKAWGLAGARCGFVLADASLISILQGVRAPYPMSRPSIQEILSVFSPENTGAMLRSVESILAQKKRLEEALQAMPGVDTVFPSQANFVLIRSKSKQAILKTALQEGVVLRDRGSDEGLAGCVRITAGSAAETDAAIDCVRKALPDHSGRQPK